MDKMRCGLWTLATLALLQAGAHGKPETVALWLFDEPAGVYPSTPLDTSAGLDAPLVLGLGGSVIPGRFGNAVSTVPYPPTKIPSQGEETAALGDFPIPKGSTQEPLTWRNNQFTALMTSGENHLRKQVSFVRPTHTDMNLGNFDWTVEFWGRARGEAAWGTLLEVGTGPRGENQLFTRIGCNLQLGAMSIEQMSGGPAVETVLEASSGNALSPSWHHFALVHHSASMRLVLFLDGKQRAEAEGVTLNRLPQGSEDYMSIGRDGAWRHALPGAIDELRISRGAVYTRAFEPPESFAPVEPMVELERGPPLLFAPDSAAETVVPLGQRKCLFIDGSLIARSENVEFAVKPPRRIDRVDLRISSHFRKHLTVIEDPDGLIRIYNGGIDDYLIVHTSHDGLHFTAPDTGLHHKDARNVVIAEPAPLGRPIIDFNGPAEYRWKYVSGLEGRGVYLYTSPDGWTWRRHRTAVLPFRSGSQSSLYYDDQRGLYVGFHRTGFPMSLEGGTQREFVRSEARDIFHPWPVTFLSQEQVWDIAKNRPLRSPQPWWLDNGPLTPGDFGVELPTSFAPDPAIDPAGSGIYVPKAGKYPWATDTYLAFPSLYFDYEQPRLPAARRALMDPVRGLGSGQVETQMSVSRDGIHWRRLPSPAYIPAGRICGRDLHQVYMGEGMVRRGNEIWQYFFGREDYHSPVKPAPGGDAVYRAVQRLDGFVAAESAYDRLATLTTKPFRFQGNRLVLNIDTGAMGYAQIGIVGEDGSPIPGFEWQNCVYINGDFIAKTVEWLTGSGHPAHTDVSALAGRPVRLVMKMRGTSLYAFQFEGR
ncbi:MAG: hypothetical protein HS122_07950 [Opitutaceae bacterium]|nr:hypothetical protein [Opitutaceae bacterium]